MDTGDDPVTKKNSLDTASGRRGKARKRLRHRGTGLKGETRVRDARS